MRVTKNDMARVVAQALYNMPHLPDADHQAVMKLARSPKETLERQHKLAVTVLGQVRRQVLPLDDVPDGLGWKLVTGNTFQNVWERPCQSDA